MPKRVPAAGEQASLSSVGLNNLNPPLPRDRAYTSESGSLKPRRQPMRLAGAHGKKQFVVVASIEGQGQPPRRRQPTALGGFDRGNLPGVDECTHAACGAQPWQVGREP